MDTESTASRKSFIDGLPSHFQILGALLLLIAYAKENQAYFLLEGAASASLSARQWDLCPQQCQFPAMKCPHCNLHHPVGANGLWLHRLWVLLVSRQLQVISCT